jgi:hypothetical protein
MTAKELENKLIALMNMQELLKVSPNLKVVGIARETVLERKMLIYTNLQYIINQH